MTRNGRGPNVPHDPSAEEAVLGMLLVMPYEIDALSQLLTADDFYSPKHAVIYDALCAMFDDGTAIDNRSVAARISGSQFHVTAADLGTLAAEAPTLTHLSTHATRVMEMASRRKLLVACADITRNAHDMGTTWADVAGVASERVAAAVTDIDPVGRTTNVAEFVDRYNVDPDWVVPSMIERGEKVLLVGREGGGKSMLLRQWAVQIAAGLHPRSRTPIPPRRVMLVDLENGPRIIAKWLARIWNIALEAMPEADADNLRVVPRPDGIDLTTRADKRWLWSRIADARPDVLFLGPVYKLHRGEEERSGDTGTIARELDALRVKFGCALLMETHAPHESFREGAVLRPAGSRVWMRWPDFVLGFKPLRPSAPEGVWLLDDRLKHRDVRYWPKRLQRTDRWPWDTLEPTHDERQEDRRR